MEGKLLFGRSEILCSGQSMCVFVYLGIDYFNGIPINLYTYRKCLDTGVLKEKHLVVCEVLFCRRFGEISGTLTPSCLLSKNHLLCKYRVCILSDDFHL